MYYLSYHSLACLFSEGGFKILIGSCVLVIKEAQLPSPSSFTPQIKPVLDSMQLLALKTTDSCRMFVVWMPQRSVHACTFYWGGRPR